MNVNKVWKAADGSDLDADSMVPVHVQLMKTVDGKTTSVGDPVELNAENGWTHTFTKLPVSESFNGRQADVTYSVEELAVDGFKSEVTGNAKDGFTVTNTQIPPVSEVSVKKTWQAFDGSDLDSALTMPVKVQLMKSIGAEKTPVGEPVELNAENGWTHTFDELPVSEKVDGEQIDITYSVEELEVDGFTSKVTGDAASGFTITNTQT
ncbi:Cna B-type domain-containing protein, partial [Dermabacter hominis]|uniref:Cna B-type domain-containing protein n=1 Tax=Dermabacter hominis TaxID=36740 RepID=UPI0021A6ED44